MEAPVPNTGTGGCQRRSKAVRLVTDLKPVGVRSAVCEQDAGFLAGGVESLRELDLGDQVLHVGGTGPEPVIWLSDVERQQDLFAIC